MLEPALLPTPLTDCTDEALARAGVELRLKRDDLLHPTVPGNKWRKLAPNLAAAVEQGHTRLLTFGGAYSTHLRAVAVAAGALGLESVGLVRGEELAGAPRNWSLRAAEAAGMRLEFLPRSAYRETAGRWAADTGVEAALRHGCWGPCLVLPEGGSNALAAIGAAAVPAELPDLGARDVVCCPVGTGGTLAGIAAGLPPGARALGVAVLRGGGRLPGGRGRPAAPGRVRPRVRQLADRPRPPRRRLRQGRRPRSPPSPRTSSGATGSRWSTATSPSCSPP